MAANLELVRRFIEAFNEGELDALVATLDPEVELHSLKGLRRGLDEARLWASRPPGGVQQTIEIEALHELGEQVLAVIVRHWQWAEDAEPAGSDEMAWLFTLRDGRILRWKPYEVREEALGLLDAPQ